MKLATAFVTLLIFAAAIHAQATNLLQNPDADQGVSQWRAFGNAKVEGTSANDFCFVVRAGGYLFQDVELPKGSVGMYAVLTGRGSSERINPDGAITDSPYLYGYMMEKATDTGGIVLDYLQGQEMVARPNLAGTWANMSGIFKVPEKTTKVRFFLSQALRNGVPHDNSAARFDNLGLYLFVTREEAEAFVNAR